MLQDAWVRYRGVDHSVIRSPKAFMTTVVTRLCLDRLKSAQKTREEYVGPWLPEPVLTSELENPETMMQRSESVTLAFLVLLEQLSPEERAVFLLKDVFEYGHSEIADILGTTTENSRQLLHRAKTRLQEGRPRSAGTTQSRRAIAERFAQAFSSGNASELTALLMSDVGMWSDGGGKAAAARRPFRGRDQVLKFLIGLHRTAETAGMIRDASLTIEDINSEPALVVRLGAGWNRSSCCQSTTTRFLESASSAIPTNSRESIVNSPPCTDVSSSTCGERQDIGRTPPTASRPVLG